MTDSRANGFYRQTTRTWRGETFNQVRKTARFGHKNCLVVRVLIIYEDSSMYNMVYMYVHLKWLICVCTHSILPLFLRKFLVSMLLSPGKESCIVSAPLHRTRHTAVHGYQEEGLLWVARACKQPQINKKRCPCPRKLRKSLEE